MKKNRRRLSLSRETIRTLVDMTTARVAGGAEPRPTQEPNSTCVWDTHYSCPTWPEVCNPTFTDPNTTIAGEIP